MSVEARWFVRGDLPVELRPQGSGRRRVDSYCAANLSPVSSVKRRGDHQTLECKVRIGRTELVQYGTAIGFAERWVKHHVNDLSPALAGGPWLAVRKQIWRVDGAEIARLNVAGVRWWTMAVCVEADTSTPRNPLFAWIDMVATAGTAHSYASWLIERCCESSVPLAVA